MDYFKVLLNQNNKNIIQNIDLFTETSVVISAFVTGYARIHMNKIKLTIINNREKVYYTDTDSIVTDLSLDELSLILGDKLGNKLGQLKYEKYAKEAYFITNKTYCLIHENEEFTIKAKGVN